MNNLPQGCCAAASRPASNPQFMDRKSDALPLNHRAAPTQTRKENVRKEKKIFLCATILVNKDVYIVIMIDKDSQVNDDSRMG